MLYAKNKQYVFIFRPFTALIFILILTPFVRGAEDLYEVLGVRKSASHSDIRKAYKSLAREWHPDKNKDPSASDRFTKINEAYETLGHKSKREQYDNFGYTSAQEPPQHGRGQNFGSFHPFFQGGPFEGFNFRGGGGGDSVLDKYHIYQRNYVTNILPNSSKKPYFVYVYSDFCIPCMRMEHLIEKLLSELEGVGIGIGTVHAAMNPAMVSELRLTNVPSIVGIINGRLSFFKGDVSMHHLRDFVRNLFPSNTVTQVTDINAIAFLESWVVDNRMRALFFNGKETPVVRYLKLAFYHRERISCGYVWMNDPDSVEVIIKYNINRKQETLLMINEDTDSIAASISMKQIPASTLEEVMEANRYLSLPRLSSQGYFDDLCPVETKARRRRLCVVLVTRKNGDFNDQCTSFRHFAQNSRLQQDRVRFAYMYEDVQSHVMTALMKEEYTQTKGDILKVVIVWRTEKSQLSYEWLTPGWGRDEEALENTRERLEWRLQQLLNSETGMAYRTILPEFYNEHGLALLTRIFNRLMQWWERVYLYFTSFSGTTISTVVVSVFLVIMIGLLFQTVSSVEEKNVQSQAKPTNRPRPPSRTIENQVNLYQMKTETYKDLVSEADTGITFIILVDLQSRDKLLQRFVEIMLPYSRYSGLTFAYLQLEHYVTWYRFLLEQALDFKVELENINIHNCIGTVLAVNGYRKYFYIFHAKHARRWVRAKDHLTQAMGLTDSDDSDTETPILLAGELLNGLNNWIDRVFDGTIRRIRVPNWPDLVTPQ